MTGQVSIVQALLLFFFFLKQILYMYINRRQIDTTYFLYFLLHLCVPSLNSPLVTLQGADTRSIEEGDKVRLYLAGRLR